MKRLSLVLACAALCAGCASVRASSRCNEEANACLRGCPQSTSQATLRVNEAGFDQAYRKNDCETRCESVLGACQKREAEVKPVEGPVP